MKVAAGSSRDVRRNVRRTLNTIEINYSGIRYAESSVPKELTFDTDSTGDSQTVGLATVSAASRRELPATRVRCSSRSARTSPALSPLRSCSFIAANQPLEESRSSRRLIQGGRRSMKTRVSLKRAEIRCSPVDTPPPTLPTRQHCFLVRRSSPKSNSCFRFIPLLSPTFHR